jgi:hypothetical protein
MRNPKRMCERASLVSWPLQSQPGLCKPLLAEKGTGQLVTTAPHGQCPTLMLSGTTKSSILECSTAKSTVHHHITSTFQPWSALVSPGTTATTTRPRRDFCRGWPLASCLRLSWTAQLTHENAMFMHPNNQPSCCSWSCQLLLESLT